MKTKWWTVSGSGLVALHCCLKSLFGHHLTARTSWRIWFILCCSCPRTLSMSFTAVFYTGTWRRINLPASIISTFNWLAHPGPFRSLYTWTIQTLKEGRGNVAGWCFKQSQRESDSFSVTSSLTATIRSWGFLKGFFSHFCQIPGEAVLGRTQIFTWNHI